MATLCLLNETIELEKTQNYRIDIEEYEDQFDDLQYVLREDALLLECEKYDLYSVLGLLEEGFREMQVQEYTYHRKYNTKCVCHHKYPHLDWSVPHRIRPNAVTQLPQLRVFQMQFQTIQLTPGKATHFLRSILGVDHANTPWNNSTSENQDQVVVVVVVLAQLALHDYQTLIRYRTSDASPSWFLHAVQEPDTVIYRRMPPRTCLTGDGLVLYNKHEQPMAPPYLDVKDYYPQVLALLEHQDILRKEASNIPRFIPWPEQAHYAPTEHSETPWTVFPLCHCFPASQPENRTWIPQTCQAAPETTRLLQKYLGDSLRTALFSRLEPHAVLEAHTGWQDLANYVYRIHVPIIIPDHNLCGLWVDGCVETHTPDRILCFDDSKIHRAFNHSDHARIVLILDLERPPSLPLGTAEGGHSDELDKFIEQMGL